MLKSWRFWFFNALLLSAVIMMVVSFMGPWWTSRIEPAPGQPSAIGMVIEIFQWGIPEGPHVEHYMEDVTPDYQIALARIFLAGSIALAFASSWLRGLAGKLILGLVGAAWVGYALGAYYLISSRTAEYGMPLQGKETVYDFVFIVVATSGFEFEYYLAYAAGLLCILPAVMRSLITGKLLK